MALALVVQLALPFVAMPQMAGSGPISLGRAAAIWGLANICLAPGEQPEKGGGDQGEGPDHDCPFCQLSQQAGGLLPAPLVVVPAPAFSGLAPVTIASVQSVARLGLSAAPPRAPPLV